MRTRTCRAVAVILSMTVMVVVILGVTAATAAATEQRNPDCLLCHETAQQFAAVAVDKDTACPACHTPGLLGTHPYHQQGANCGAFCHSGWGESLYSAVPAYLSSAGSFASSTSQDTDPGTLHLIHSQPRWPSGISTSSSECASCHAAAACDACHTSALSPVHDTHGSTLNPEYARTVGYGIIGEDQTINSVTAESKLCGTAECHDVLSLEDGTPLMKENFSHQAYPQYGYPEANTVTKSGSWGVQRSSSYTANQMSISNGGGATFSLSFTGNKIAFISDLDPYRGKGEVWIDGALAGTFDSYSPTTKYQSVTWVSPILTNGPHTVLVKALGTKQASSRGTWVSVDAFRVWSPMREYIAPDCDASCHADKSSGHGGNFSHEASQTVGTYPPGRFACTDCHSLSMWTEHARTSSKTEPAGCNACHTTYADYALDDFVNSGTGNWGSCTWAGDGTTTGCHQVGNGEDPHNFTDTDHDASGIGSTSDCRSCHGDDLSVIHDDTNAGRAEHTLLSANAYSTDCLTCHGTDPTFPSTKDCTDSGCHVASGVVSMATHPAPPHNGTNNNSGVPRTGGKTCSTCHVLELTTEHGKATSVTDPGGSTVGCLDCHNAAYFPTAWLDTPGTTNTCNACHDPAGATDAGLPHESADYTAKHDWDPPAANASSCGGSYCHDGDTAWLDDINAVDVLHDASKPGAADCTSCHDTNIAVPTETLCSDCHSAHTATATVHDASAATVAANSDCVTCHTSYTAAQSAHSNGCAGCHENATLSAASSQYLGGNYDMTCTGCHNSTDLGSYDYQPYDPNHYDPYLANHTANYGSDSVPTGGSTVTSKPCTACHATSLKAEHVFTLSSGAVDCFDCHTSTAPIDAAAQVAANWTNDKCADCHGTNHGGTGQATHDMSASATSLGCSAGGCHDADTDDAAKLHGDAVKSGAPSVTSCNVCHTNADTNLSAISGCDSCHTGHDMTVHEVTTDTGDCLRCHGNDGTPADDVRGVHANCDQCHNNASYSGITTGKTSDCVDCHNAALVSEPHNSPDGDYDPYDPNHYNGTESTHTADGNDTGFAYTDAYQCVDCHLLEIKPEHFKTTSAFSTVPGTYAEKCSACHEANVDALGTWNNRCEACHDPNQGAGGPHTAFPGNHNAKTQWDTSCGGAGCHDTDQVDEIHNDSVTGNATVTTCLNTCHTTNTAIPTSVNCDTSGCHSGAGHGHELSVASSDYNNTTQAGCTNSGAGCHGTDSNADYQEYHLDSGCTSGPCHTSSNQADTAFDNPNTCQNCHTDSAYQNAPDTVALTDASPAGHYGETTHTATGLSATMIGATGGLTTAACSDCHSPTNAAGIDGLWHQHQNLRAGVGSLTCSDCHNKNAAIQTIVTDATRDDACTDCHTSGVVEVAHASGTAPVVNATEADGAGSCMTSGCHTTLNLHELHKGDTGTLAQNQTCALSGCHSYSAQGIKPTQTSCGTSGACHTTDAHDPAAHTTTSAVNECTDCHGTTDIKAQHNNDCSTCHNTGDNLGGTGNTADCTDCHGDEVQNPETDYTGHTASSQHYSTAATTHTAAPTQMTTNLTGSVQSEKGASWGSVAYSFQCQGCHVNTLMNEHAMTGADFSNVPPETDNCVGCHQATNFSTNSTNWLTTKQCSECHKTTGGSAPVMHGSMATKHNASSVTEAQRCGGGSFGSDCHDISDVAKIHTYDAASSDGNVDKQACTIACHKGSTQANRPAATSGLRCNNSGCHDGIGTTWWNDVNGSSTANALAEHALYHNTQSVNRRDGNAATGPAVQDGSSTINNISQCVGCHEINRMDRDHYAITGAPYGTSPWSGETSNIPSSYNGKACAPCHRKTANSTSPSAVSAAGAKAAIAGDDMKCPTCHTGTSWVDDTSWKMHEDRGTGALGNTEFRTGYSGHRSFSFMPGMVNSWNGFTIARPDSNLWLNAYGQALTGGTGDHNAMVKCNECHTYTGATGPHGSAMTIDILPGYGEYKFSYLVEVDSEDDGMAAFSASLGNNNNSVPDTSLDPICVKCHDIYDDGAAEPFPNRPHDKHAREPGNKDSASFFSRQNRGCTTCHSAIPHAWKRPRLIAYDSDGAPWYAWSGDTDRVRGIRSGNLSLTSGSVQTWDKDFCWANGCGNKHQQSDFNNGPGSVW